MKRGSLHRRAHRASGGAAFGAGADLSVASDHHDGRFSARRADRHAGAHRRRRHEDCARPADRGRNRQRRRRHDRDRTCRPRRAGRLHDRHRQLVEPCRLAGDLSRSNTTCSRICSRSRCLRLAPLWILGKNDLPPNNVAELIAWLKARQEPSDFRHRRRRQRRATVRRFTSQQKTGAHFQYVPYRGAAPAMQDLIGGQIDLSCLEASATLPTSRPARSRPMR